MHLYSEMGWGRGTPGYTDCVCLFISGLGAGRGALQGGQGTPACQYQIRRWRKLGGSQGLYVWRWGGEVQGGWWWLGGGQSPVAVPLPCLLHTPCKAELLTPNATSPQPPAEPGRREETGGWDKGWSGGRRRKGGRVSWRQAGREARQMLAGGATASFSELPSACSVGAVSSGACVQAPGLA